MINLATLQGGQQSTMNGFLFPLLTLAVVFVLVLRLAVVLFVSALAAITVLPRGSVYAGRLRRLGSEVPRWVWSTVIFLDRLVFAAAVAGGIAVTFVVLRT